MILPIGAHVKSLRDERIVGTVRGYGTLFPLKKGLFSGPNTVVVYLVWDDCSPGSNSSVNPTVHVLNIDQIEELA